MHKKLAILSTLFCFSIFATEPPQPRDSSPPTEPTSASAVAPNPQTQPASENANTLTFGRQLKRDCPLVIMALAGGLLLDQFGLFGRARIDSPTVLPPGVEIYMPHHEGAETWKEAQYLIPGKIYLIQRKLSDGRASYQFMRAISVEDEIRLDGGAIEDGTFAKGSELWKLPKDANNVYKLKFRSNGFDWVLVQENPIDPTTED